MLGWALGLSAAYHLLIVMMILDVASGLLAGHRNGGLDSDISWRGMRKKGLTLVVVTMAAILGNYASLPTGEWAAGAFALVEVISILENAQRGGVEIPTWLRQTAERILGKKGGL